MIPGGHLGPPGPGFLSIPAAGSQLAGLPLSLAGECGVGKPAKGRARSQEPTCSRQLLEAAACETRMELTAHKLVVTRGLGDQATWVTLARDIRCSCVTLGN